MQVNIAKRVGHIHPMVDRQRLALRIVPVDFDLKHARSAGCAYRVPCLDCQRLRVCADGFAVDRNRDSSAVRVGHVARGNRLPARTVAYRGGMCSRRICNKCRHTLSTVIQ